jgi:uncharacterized protein (TIGR03083 family)
VEHWDAIAAQRRALADRLDGLSAEQWSTQSLCAAWTVQDMAAHLIVPHEISIPRFALMLAEARGSFRRANVAMTARVASRPAPQLVADLRRLAGSRAKPPGFGSEAPLTEILVHSQDIGLPLGWPVTGPLDPWADALTFLVSSKARRGFMSRPVTGLRLVALDVDFTYGSGEEVFAPAVALAMTLMGRGALVHDLDGPGAAKLAAFARS